MRKHRPRTVAAGARSIVVAHPSPDVYGSDRQLVESVAGLVEHGWHPTVMLPADGPLRAILERQGAHVVVRDFPVLRKGLLRPRAFLGFLLRAPVTVGRLRSVLRRSGACAVYVNTLTIPLWVIAARLARLPVLCHSHEAEQVARPVQVALAAPLLLAQVVVANSEATRSVLTTSVGRLSRRTVVVHNGVPDSGPPTPLRQRTGDDELRLALVSRLSPRKGVHVALDAVAALREQDRSVTLDICGSTFPGYEWYERQLRNQVRDRGLSDVVTFHGYVHPTRPLLDTADVVLVPSFGESFGNVAVEAMLAGRPVVASAVQGLAEVIDDGHTGILVEPDSAEAIASAVATLGDDFDLAARLALNGRHDAVARFGLTPYRTRIAALLSRVTQAGRSPDDRGLRPSRSPSVRPEPAQSR